MYASSYPLIIEKGALCFYSIFSVDLWGGGINEVNEFWEKFEAGDFFNTSLFCGKKGNSTESCCECFEIVDIFHAMRVPLNAFYRKYVGTTWFRLKDRCVRLQVFVSLYPYRNLGIMYFNVPLEELRVDDVIVIRQKFEEACYEPCGEERNIDWREICTREFHARRQDCVGNWKHLKRGEIRFLCKSLIEDITLYFKGCKKKNYAKAIKKYRDDCQEELEIIIDDISICEPMIFSRSATEIQAVRCGEVSGDDIKGEKSRDEISLDDAKRWALRHCLSMYGLVTGDEGYVYVPYESAREKVKNGWRSRNFIYIFVYGYHVVSLNFKCFSEKGREYVEFQRKLNDGAGQEKRRKYFDLQSCVAGVDHGVVNCIERSMIVSYEYHYIARRDMDSDIVFTRKRTKILTFIYRTSFSREEIEDLYRLISDASGTSKYVELMRHRCTLQTEEKSLHNQRRNNLLVLALTCVSLALGFFTISDSSILIKGTEDEFYYEIWLWLIWIQPLLVIVIIAIYNRRDIIRFYQQTGGEIYKRARKWYILKRKRRDEEWMIPD